MSSEYTDEEVGASPMTPPTRDIQLAQLADLLHAGPCQTSTALNAAVYLLAQQPGARSPGTVKCISSLAAQLQSELRSILGTIQAACTASRAHPPAGDG